MAEVVFVKERGKERKDNQELNLEEFISIKGITAMGNQLTKDKVLEINALSPLPYEKPEEKKTEDLDVVDEEEISDEHKTETEVDTNTETSTDREPPKASMEDQQKASADDEEEPPLGEDGQAKLF